MSEHIGRLTVSLVEDNIDFAQTVRDFLAKESDLELTGMSHDEASFQKNVRDSLPDIALVDLGLSRPDSGVDLIAWMGKEFPAVRPVVLTTDERAISHCYELG